ncbi:hypothetical protein EDC04DRAFT_2082794 [Pisolithus marmoratus]|nr:hypothetical protein EDC04DRAFT_2082794 [Pisolithus marmoratus]
MVGISFTGDTHFEVITVLANCGTDTVRAREALVTWIQRKQGKGRSTQHILTKLRQLEQKFIKDISLHDAFRQARAVTFLPRSPDLPLPEFITKRQSHGSMQSLDSPVIDVTHAESSRYNPLSSPHTPVFSRTSCRCQSPSYSERRLDPYAEEPELPSTSYNPPSPEGSQSLFYSSSQTHHLPTTHRPYPLVATGGAAYGLKSPTLSPPSPTMLPRRYRSASNPAPPKPAVSRRSIPPPNRLSEPAIPAPPTPRPAPTQPIPQSACSSAASSTVSLASPVSPAPQPYSDLGLRMPSPLPSSPYSSKESVMTVTDIERYVPSDIDVMEQECFSNFRVITRSDSPLYGFAGNASQNRNSTIGTGLAPSYADALAHLQSEHGWEMGPRLDKALKICNASLAVKEQVLKCLRSEPGCDPPHWQSRLRECNINPEAVDFIVDEMCRELEDAPGRAL